MVAIMSRVAVCQTCRCVGVFLLHWSPARVNGANMHRCMSGTVAGVVRSVYLQLVNNGEANRECVNQRTDAFVLPITRLFSAHVDICTIYICASLQAGPRCVHVGPDVNVNRDMERKRRTSREM